MGKYRNYSSLHYSFWGGMSWYKKQQYSPKVDKDEVIHSTLQIPRKIKISQGATKEFVLPAFLIDSAKISSFTTEDVLEEIRAEDDWQENAYVNEDESITLVLNQKQLEKWISSTEKFLTDTKESHSDKITIEISEDYQTAKYFISSGCGAEEFGLALLSMTVNMIKAQVFSGVGADEWNVKVTLIKKETDEVVYQVHFPYENMNIEEWEKMFSKDDTGVK